MKGQSGFNLQKRDLFLGVNTTQYLDQKHIEMLRVYGSLLTRITLFRNKSDRDGAVTDLVCPLCFSSDEDGYTVWQLERHIRVFKDNRDGSSVSLLLKSSKNLQIQGHTSIPSVPYVRTHTQITHSQCHLKSHVHADTVRTSTPPIALTFAGC